MQDKAVKRRTNSYEELPQWRPEIPFKILREEVKFMETVIPHKLGLIRK